MIVYPSEAAEKVGKAGKNQPMVVIAQFSALLLGSDV